MWYSIRMSADIPEKETVRPEETGGHPEESKKESANAVPRVTSESNAIPPTHNAHASKRKKKCWLEWGKFTVEVLTLIVISVYTRIAYHQWQEMIKSTNAAKSAADTAQDTLVASNRPWLELRPHIVGPLTLNEQGEIRIILQVDAENIGHSPAVRVASQQKAIQLILNTPNPWQELRNVCEQASAQSENPHNRGVTSKIFPSKPYQELINVGLSKEEVARSVNDIFPAAGTDPHIHPAVIWCVAYRADFSEVVHRTGYVWEVKRRTANGPPVDIDRNSTVPASELVIEQYWPLGPLAD